MLSFWNLAMKFSRIPFPLLWAVLSALSGAKAIAQTSLSFNIQPPPDADSDNRGSVGPERRDCDTLANVFMPIVPNYSTATDVAPGQRYGWSSPDQPTLWFYLPYETELIETADFSVWRLESQGEPTLIYDAIIEQPQRGFFSIVLDDQSQPLTPQTLYQVTVYVEAYCDTTSPIIEDTATAWIKVVAAEAPAAGLPIAAQVADYLDRSLWYDAANVALQQYCHDQTSTELQTLLQAALGESFTFPEQAECAIANSQSE